MSKEDIEKDSIKPKGDAQSKKDWEELEKWDRENKQDEIINYGVDFSKINEKKERKTTKKYVKGVRIAEKTLKTIGITIVVLLTIYLILLACFWYHNMKIIYDINAKKTVESMYNIKVKIISKELDDRGNGKFIFETKGDPQIQFVAIKRFGSLGEDFADRTQKYYFDKWNGESKKDFKVCEVTKDDILSYATYIENFTDIDTALNEMFEFVDFCNSQYVKYFDIFIQVSENLALYPNLWESTDKTTITKQIKDEYYDYLNKNNN